MYYLVKNILKRACMDKKHAHFEMLWEKSICMYLTWDRVGLA